MTARKRVSRRSSGSDLARVDAHEIRRHEYDELRMVGLVPEGNTLYYVAFVDRGEVRHVISHQSSVISLRYAERKEIKHYVENYS